MKKEDMPLYIKNYRRQNPEWMDYLYVNDMMKKVLIRIRDAEYGFRQKPLSEKDLEAKRIFEEKWLPGMNWKNYGVYWSVKQDDLIHRVRNGQSRTELIDANLFKTIYKTTKK